MSESKLFPAMESTEEIKAYAYSKGWADGRIALIEEIAKAEKDRQENKSGKRILLEFFDK